LLEDALLDLYETMETGLAVSFLAEGLVPVVFWFPFLAPIITTAYYTIGT